jgi:NiFe hydrogenase small subunit HydA
MNDEILTCVETKPGLSRRTFLQFCAVMAVTLGLPPEAEGAIAQALTTKHRPVVIWLHFAECTGCTESMLCTEHPALDKLILELISLDYHETLFAGAGRQADAARRASMAANKGKYVLVVEGAIPAKDNGIYCKIGGRTAVEILNECAQDAAAVIALGSCAVWGGMPSTKPNPTGCVGVDEVWKKPVVNIPGCAPNPYNFLSTVVHYITYGKLPELDNQGRPKFAYARIIHENCERRPHFDAGRFAQEPLQAGLQGAGDPRQLSCDPVRRCRRWKLAGRHGPSLHRLHRKRHWLREAYFRLGGIEGRNAASLLSRYCRATGTRSNHRIRSRAGGRCWRCDRRFGSHGQQSWQRK